MDPWQESRFQALESKVNGLETNVTETRTMLVGLNGMGGIITRLERVAERTHQLANDVAKVQLGIEAQKQELSELVTYLKERK